ncbi:MULTISPECIES: hypothetical protein [unclassified Streptomyces]|uniref:hypothetical protein n=1 Tax=unclassified Streptomyces TaxID=2593676 RepID=UPI000DD9901C|nr:MULTISPECIES: hypothetical protein [unclassified Streptomyces]QZZ26504.1 hypothetical protein A7X85_09785 [Streptomyces sp. ST1015]
MTIQIFEGQTGRSIAGYDLLTEAVDTYGVDRAEAHETILSLLQGIVETDGPHVILDRQPIRPHLLEHNPGVVDINHWLTASDETAGEIREGLAAVYAAADL